MDERKEYDFKGTVTISTEEYKDLVAGVERLTARLDKKDHEYWEEYRRANKAEEALSKAKDELRILNAFIDSSEELALKLKLFKVEQTEKEKEEDEND